MEWRVLQALGRGVGNRLSTLRLFEFVNQNHSGSLSLVLCLTLANSRADFRFVYGKQGVIVIS